MDFSQWSPSHLLVVAITLLAFGGQLIAILTYLKLTAKQHSAEIKQIADAIIRQGERLEDRIDKRVDEIRVEMNQRLSDVQSEIRDVRTELSKLNQNHIDHLTHHERP